MTEKRATNITFHDGSVSREHRAKLMGHAGCSIWLTGLSGSGKSTVAVAAEQLLHERGVKCYRLDGDNIRFGLNQNLGFTPEDRVENIRRIGEVTKLMADAGLVCLNSFVSPYLADRQLVRELHDKAGLPFYEVYVHVPLEVAEQRDPKGLYKKARAGEIKNFTGIDDPYEAPQSADLTINTAEHSVEASASMLLDFLSERGAIV